MFLQRLDSFDANRCAELGASLGSLPSVSVTLPGVPMGSIACLDWNLDGSRIALGSSDASTRIFVPDYTGSRSGLRFFSAIPGHKEAISQVAWSPVVESVLAIGSSDKTVGFNDCRHKRKIGGVATKGENFILEWSPDGNFIAIGDRAGVVTIVDGRTFKIMNSYNFSKIEDVLDMSWGPDGKHLLLVGASGKVHVRTFPDLKQSYTFLGHTGACYAMEMDPGSKFLATGGQDAFVFIWELEHMVNISAISSLDSPIRALSISHDSQLIASTAEYNKHIDIADVKTGESVHQIPCGRGLPGPLKWHPSKLLLAYTSFDSSILGNGWDISSKTSRSFNSTVKLFGITGSNEQISSAFPSTVPDTSAIFET